MHSSEYHTQNAYLTNSLHRRNECRLCRTPWPHGNFLCQTKIRARIGCVDSGRGATHGYTITANKPRACNYSASEEAASNDDRSNNAHQSCSVCARNEQVTIKCSRGLRYVDCLDRFANEARCPSTQNDVHAYPLVKNVPERLTENLTRTHHGRRFVVGRHIGHAVVS